jgi:hypothetical protein
LSFQQNDPRIRRRTEELVQFGRAAYLDHLFKIYQGRSPDPDLEHREPYSPGASRLVTSRDVMRNGEIAAPDDVKWVATGQEAQLTVGDVLVRTIQNINVESPGLLWARVTETDLPLSAGNAVIVLRPLGTTSAEDVERDRLGVKPMYYTHVGDRVVFASELKSLLASGLIGTERRSSLTAMANLPCPAGAPRSAGWRAR